MDESINGTSPLRSVSRSTGKKLSPSSSLKTNPRAEKRRRLRLQHRNEQLIQLWRVFLFSSITYGLGFLVIKNGWSPIDVEHIQVKGSQKIQPFSIINSSGLKFPKPFFLINPQQLEANLMKELPLKSLSIRRRLIPPNIEIIVQERKPLAFAEKRVSQGKEKGMVDKDGHWIPIRMGSKTTSPTTDIYVEGWMPSHRDWISIILKNQEKIGSPLKRIIVKPNGEINLKTEDFEMIHLGGNSIYLKEQLNALHQLSKNLPENFMSQEGTILDIRDPSRPEFQIPKSEFKKTLKN